MQDSDRADRRISTLISKAKPRGLNSKLVFAFLVIGTVPLLIIGWFSTTRAAAALEEASGDRLEVAAIETANMIDRNLLERYGDVQAFAANPKATGTATERQEIIDFMTTTYGIYDLMLIVDLDGIVTAVNSVDGSGASIDTSHLMGIDVSGESWFSAAIRLPSGQTHYSDAELDSLVGSVYGGEHLSLGFTAPVRDNDGQPIAIWHNEASFERIVSDIMESTRDELVDSGAESVVTLVLRRDGAVLDNNEHHPELSHNAVNDGFEAATNAISDAHGVTHEADPSDGIDRINGYATAHGALGFDGYGWGVLIGQDSAEATAVAHGLRNTIILVGLLAAAAIAAVGTWLARGISKPIADIAEQAEKISQGNLAVDRVEINRTDEIGELATSFDEMVTVLKTVGSQARLIADKDLSSSELDVAIPGELGEALETMIASIRSMVGELRGSSQQLAGAAEELSSVSVSMGSSAEQTSQQATSASATGDQVSSSVATVAAAIEEMNATIREVSLSASEASNVASEAVDVARFTSATITKLGESSEEIGGVINVINSIAEQTNLLALNATIEAARAGEAGKGFAVVASEVKELANQTATATEEIATRIQTIQEDMTGAVQANEQIGETIDKINEISATIASAVEEQSVTTAEIGRSIEEAASGTQEIARSITEVASAADSTRQSTDDTRRSAEEMSKMAVGLNELVDAYK